MGFNQDFDYLRVILTFPAFKWLQKQEWLEKLGRHACPPAPLSPLPKPVFGSLTARFKMVLFYLLFYILHFSFGKIFLRWRRIKNRSDEYWVIISLVSISLLEWLHHNVFWYTWTCFRLLGKCFRLLAETQFCC